MTEIGVQHPEIGVQLPPKPAFNFLRNRRSTSSEKPTSLPRLSSSCHCGSLLRAGQPVDPHLGPPRPGPPTPSLRFLPEFRVHPRVAQRGSTARYRLVGGAMLSLAVPGGTTPHASSRASTGTHRASRETSLTIGDDTPPRHMPRLHPPDAALKQRPAVRSPPRRRTAHIGRSPPAASRRARRGGRPAPATPSACPCPPAPDRRRARRPLTTGSRASPDAQDTLATHHHRPHELCCRPQCRGGEAQLRRIRRCRTSSCETPRCSPQRG